MTRISAWILAFTKGIGGAGMFVIAFLDSSFLSFPVVTDATIVSMVVAHRERVLYYAGMATLGSVAGCVVLYSVAKKSEETFLRKRFHAGRIEWASGLIRRYGALAIIVPALLPPPAPFKLFVLLAGLAEVPLPTFIISITIGRGIRYFGEGILALLWGEAAFEYLRRNAGSFALALAVFAVLAVAVYFWRKAPQSGRPAQQPSSADKT